MKAEEVVAYAAKLYDAFETEEREGKRITLIKQESPYRDELVNLTYQVSHEISLGTDSVYDFTREALSTIADSQAETESELEDLRYEGIEADIYTADLTSWLAENVNHVYYLTEALEQGYKDGFALLQAAQYEAKCDAFQAVLQYLLDKDSEDEDDKDE